MSGVGIRLLRVLALPVGLTIGAIWLILVVLPVFIIRGGEAAEREAARGYRLADWSLGMGAFR